MENFLKRLFYIILVLFGGLSGYSLSRYTLPFFAAGLPEKLLWINFVSMIFLGMCVGYVLVPLCTWIIMKAVVKLSSALQEMPIQEVLMGSMGLLFGLILSFFINLVLQTVSFSNIPVIGNYISPLIVICCTVFLGSLGAWFGSQLVHVHSLRQFVSGGILGKGGRVILLDTSAIIDGRIGSLRETGFFDGSLVVPRFVLQELQTLSDSDDILKRNRGRRGLDLLNELRKLNDITVEDRDYKERGVDAKLIRLAQDMSANICTTDFNLTKVAAVQGVRVLNINSLSNALKSVVYAGEILEVRILKNGKEPGQGVGYLDDGTMVVVENGKRFIGEVVDAEITSVVQKSAGRMFFGKFVGKKGKTHGE
ncbi:TRAM domain-containing protein [bacterium]|nr:TRAM domain-containing protein [bacterium]